MFGGLVETLGKITFCQNLNECLELKILPTEIFTDLKIGDSVAVNGVCLTVTKISGAAFFVTAVPETLRLTNLKFLHVDSHVNLERALLMSSRIGGHYVQGHVDFCGEIIEILPEGKKVLLVKIAYPEKYNKYLINKGYIALDGMSITLITVETNTFTVTFIPHTQAVTVVNEYQVGSKINIEVDIMGKYAEKLLGVYVK